MGAHLGPTHLLFLDHAAGQDLIDSRFRETGRDALAVAPLVAIVGDEVGVPTDIAAEFAKCLLELCCDVLIVGELNIPGKQVGCFRTVDVIAMP